MKEGEINLEQVTYKEVDERLDVEPLAEIVGNVGELAAMKARGKEVYTIQN